MVRGRVVFVDAYYTVVVIDNESNATPTSVCSGPYVEVVYPAPVIHSHIQNWPAIVDSICAQDLIEIHTSLKDLVKIFPPQPPRSPTPPPDRDRPPRAPRLPRPPQARQAWSASLRSYVGLLPGA